MAIDQWTDINNEQWVETNDAQWLGAVVSGTADLGASIHGYAVSDLSALIGTHSPKDLLSYVTGLSYKDLPASVTAVEPKDLGGYIKPYPQEDLPANIHGWDTLDLSAFLNIIDYGNLPASIGTHRPKNIKALIKGWVREAEADLGANVHSFKTDDLPASIISTYLEDLPAFLFPVQPKDLSGFIHGWQEFDLPATISGLEWPWDLPASITGSPWKQKDLSASIISNLFPPYKDLGAYILTTKGREDLPAEIKIIQSSDLSAFIDTGTDIGNLPASIYPKTMRLTGIISMITMEHSDMSATISIPCFYSDYKDLEAYIRPVFQSNLLAYINPQGWTGGIKDLGAKWGYADKSVTQDKIPITLSVTGWDYISEDKLAITASIFRAGLNLGASINGLPAFSDLTASIVGENLPPYAFDLYKFREKVYSRTYTQVAVDYEDVDISFETIVRDYFYSSGSNVVAKVNKYQHFLTKVASYYSPAKARLLDRRLHKIKYLYDLEYFSSIDEAMKYAIWYVTSQPESNLQAYINPSGAYINLTSSIVGKDKVSTNTNLISTITGQKDHTYNVVLGFTNDGVGYLQF